MGQETGPRPAASTAVRRETRRTILVGAGLMGVAGAADACGGDGGEEGPGAGPGAAGRPGDGPPGGVLAQTGEVPVGGGKVFKEHRVVITQPVRGEFKAFDATCTHRGCSVDSVKDGVIVCPCHRSTFGIADGSPQGGPAERPLAAKRIVVEGTSIKLV